MISDVTLCTAGRGLCLSVRLEGLEWRETNMGQRNKMGTHEEISGKKTKLRECPARFFLNRGLFYTAFQVRVWSSSWSLALFSGA